MLALPQVDDGASEVQSNMMAIVSSIPAAPGVDDNAKPFPCDVFTREELDTCSLLQLYRRACLKVGVRPNTVVESQLPNTVEYSPYMKIIVLDLSGTFLGGKGVAAVVPLVAACRRLSHLFLPRVGLNTAVGLSLLNVISVHPCLREIDVSYNDLGTVWGRKFFSIISGSNRRIFGAKLDQTLIIPALKKKIDKQLDQNKHMKDFFSPDPLLTDRYTDEEEAAIQQRRMEEEESRRQRAELVRKEMSDRIPAWAPVALAEVSELYYKYHGSLQDILSLVAGRRTADSTQSIRYRAMKRMNNNSSSPGGTVHAPSQDAIATELRELSSIKTAVCDEVPLRDFHHFMKILGVTSLGESTDRCVLFADLFDAAFIKVSREAPSEEGGVVEVSTYELVGVPATAMEPSDGVPSLDPRYTHTRNMSVFTEEHKERILIDFSKITRMLRLHASYTPVNSGIEQQTSDTPDPSVEAGLSTTPSATRPSNRLASTLYQCCSDKLFDSRREVIECCELLDVDQSRSVTFGELLTGVTAVLQFVLAGQHSGILRRYYNEAPADSEDGRTDDIKALAGRLCEEFLQTTISAHSAEFGIQPSSPQISLFDAVKYDSLFTSAISISQSQVDAYLHQRCSPDAWAHTTRSTLASLLN